MSTPDKDHPPREQPARGARSMAPSRGRRTGWIIAVAGLLFAGFVTFALLRTAGEAPARRLRGDLPGVGSILVTLHLTPDPPGIGGVRVHVQVDEIAGAPVRGATVAATVGSEAGVRERVVLEPSGAGGHEGIVGFPDVGAWWLDVEVIGDSGLARFRFPVRVRGNI